jgi:membrane-associated phospholipid phosphatase
VSENAERITAPASPSRPAVPPEGSAVQRTRRQRRPTGAPPPLPHPIAISTTAWLLLAVVILAGAFLVSERTPWLRLGDRANTWFLRLLAEARTPWLTDVATVIKVAGSGWGVTVVGLSVVVLTMVFRRWRHLLVFVGSLFFMEIVGQWIYDGLSRPRPYGITIISSWGGYTAPSPPVATLTIFLMGAVYCLVVPGRPRTYAKATAAVIIALYCLARVYLAVDHPDDVIFGVALGRDLHDPVRLGRADPDILQEPQRVILVLGQPAHGLEGMLVFQRAVADHPVHLVPAVGADVALGVQLREQVLLRAPLDPQPERRRAGRRFQADRLDLEHGQPELVVHRQPDRIAAPPADVDMGDPAPAVGDGEPLVGGEVAERRDRYCHPERDAEEHVVGVIDGQVQAGQAEHGYHRGRRDLAVGTRAARYDQAVHRRHEEDRDPGDRD